MNVPTLLTRHPKELGKEGGPRNWCANSAVLETSFPRKYVAVQYQRHVEFR